MKIALCGTSPYSVRLIPYGDQTWKIWGCSPGLYPMAGRLDAWFELHRWEPPVIGRPDQQVPWLSPEYCGWMAQRQHVVWMADKIPNIPMSQTLPAQDLVDKYGHYFFTSSLAWMAAMAIEAILLNRELLAAGDEAAVQPAASGPADAIGFWGVDMSTEEEYVQQRSGCQFFATMAASMGIDVVVPPESDLLIPPPLYGIGERSPRAIRSRARFEMMKARKAQADQAMVQAHRDQGFIDGQMDAELYHQRTWAHEGVIKGTRFEDLWPVTMPAAAAEQPVLTTGQTAGAGAQEPKAPPIEDTPELIAAKLAGDNPHDPAKKEILAKHGLERLCSDGGAGGMYDQQAYCRVKPDQVCECIAPIKGSSST